MTTVAKRLIALANDLDSAVAAIGDVRVGSGTIVRSRLPRRRDRGSAFGSHRMKSELEERAQLASEIAKRESSRDRLPESRVESASPSPSGRIVATTRGPMD